MAEWRDVRSSLVPAFALLAVGAMLYIAADHGSAWSFRGSWFASVNPGASPPWYFIGQTLFRGMWSLGGWLALCLLAWVSARKLGPFVWSVTAVSLVWFVPRIGLAGRVNLGETAGFCI